MDVQTVKLSRRTIRGKKVKQLRKKGLLPAHMFGSGTEPQVLQGDTLVLQKLIPRVGTNIPLSVEVEGDSGAQNICFVREVQRHPVTEDLLHVDFLRVDVSQTIESEVPIMLVGDAPAVRGLHGTLLQPLQALLVESLPMNVPASIEVDISGLDDFEKGIFVRDITVGRDVTILTDPEEMVARVSAPRLEAEPVVAEEAVEGEAAEGAEAAEGGEAEEEQK